MSLEITEVSITKLESTSKIRAFAKITINNSFCVRNLKVIDGSKGMFVAMPSEKKKNSDEWIDIAFPINKETRQLITEKVLEAYDKDDNGGIF